MTDRAGGHVLLVDDDEHGRRIVATMLRHHGLDVTTAESAAEALKAARTSPPDVVVADVSRPDGPGAELLRAMAQSPTRAVPPCVGLTSGIFVREPADLGLPADAVREWLITPACPLDVLAAVQRQLAA